MCRRLLVIAGLFLLAGTAWGQTAPVADQTEQVKALLERIERLERRVAELESRQAAYAQAPAPAGVAADQPPEAKAAAVGTAPARPTEQHGEQAAVAQQVEVHYPSLQIRGFADVDFAATDQHGTTSGFNMGQFVLHLASPLSRKVSYFGEVTFNAQPTGYTVEVERSIIRYDYNDHFKLSFGRYHTPVGYWNTAFHHGSWLQTTISRPEMVRFGGTFIPTHFVGLLAEGNIPSGWAGLAYSFGVGNGRSSIVSRAGDAGDVNNNRAWVANIFSRPTKFYGLQFGASVYRDKITLTDGRSFREWISAAHLVWAKENPEILAEFANVHHRQVLTDLVSNSQAFYVQLGYRLPWFEKTLKPYYRFEYIHTPLSDQILNSGDLTGSTVGLRYDISSYAAFKSEYRHTKRQAAVPSVDGLFLQTSFTF
jgi:hypothetical protein